MLEFNSHTLSEKMSSKNIAVSKMIKNDQMPAAVISLTNSFALFTDRCCNDKRATKMEINVLHKNNNEYIVIS